MFVRTSWCLAAFAVCFVSLPALAQYRIETVAGGGAAQVPILATQASMGATNGCAIDPAGNVYFSSARENSVFRIDKAGVVTRVAGIGRIRSFVLQTGHRAGAAISTPLNSPQGLAIDKAGNLYIAESGGNLVLKVNTDGRITVVAGTGATGYAGDGGLAINALLNHPTGIAVDFAGNLYIADRDNYRIRMVSAGGIITTVAGSGETGRGVGDGGQAINGEISFAESVAVDSQGNLYIADRMNSLVRKVQANGIISTVAGNGSFGFSGDQVQATSTQLNQPSAVALDLSGNLYIADSGNNRIRMVSPSGMISTVAGTGTWGYSGDGGNAASAQIAVWGLTVDSSGNLYLYGGDSLIRKISADGTITTIEGGSVPPVSDVALGTQLQYPEGLAIDSYGNLYVAEAGNHVIRKLSTDGTLVIVAGNGTPGYSGDGNSAIAAQLSNPVGVAVDSSGNLFISDYGNNVIRKVTPDHVISTIAGGGTNICPSSGAAAAVQLLNPAGLAVDSYGNLYIADSGHGCVLKTTPAGQVSSIAGSTADVSDVFLNDQTTGSNTTLYVPQGVAVDSSGTVYIADTGNSCIRMVKNDGTTTVVAGNGVFGYTGDDGAAASAQLSAAWSVSVDASGNLYIADTLNARVRRVATDGTIATIAGSGAPGYSGDGGDGRCAQLNTPWSLAVDSEGNIYISDWGNQAIRVLLKTDMAQTSALRYLPGGCNTGRRFTDRALDLFDPVSAAPLPLLSAADFAAARDSSHIRTRAIPDPNRIHEPRRPDSMTSPAANPYTPGPDPDFGYLSLLQSNLLFVQDIQRYVDVGASLGTMADAMQGLGGSSMLALRAQVMQYAGQHAWVLMMADPTNLPLALTYQTALGHILPIYDTFLPTATNQAFTPADLTSIKQYLDILPQDLLQYELYIVNGPVNEMVPWAAALTGGTSGAGISSIEGMGDVNDEALAHEIADTVFGGMQGSPLTQQWDVLWKESTNPVWDCVDAYSYFPPRPMPANEGVPWGDTNEYEDFMTVFSDWAGESGTPRINPSQSSSVLEEAVYRAQQGHPILLEKTLLVAALFTDQATQQLSLYYHGSYQWPNPIAGTLSPVQISAGSLTLRDYTFSIQNGALTSVTSPPSQVQVSGNTVSIPALSYTFPTPVPIPGFAAAAWGIE
jgi:sugar lactone lactonase YvrE